MPDICIWYFFIYMAKVEGVPYSTSQDLINAGYGGYQGWPDLEALYNFRDTGGSGKQTNPVANATTATTPVSDSASLLNKQAADEAALMAKYQGTITGQEPLQTAYERMSTEAGIPTLQTDIQKYKDQIYKVQSLLDTLEENVNARTSGTLTSEAQRNRQIAYEAAPLASSLGRLATGLQPLTEQLGTASGNVTTKLNLLSQQQAKELLPLQAQIAAFSDRAAREVSLFTLDKQNELAIYTQKVANDQAMSMAEYQRASDILKQANDYDNQVKLINEQVNANIKQYNATTGGGSGSTTDKYKFTSGSPNFSAPVGTMSSDGKWYSTGGGWIQTVG